MLLALTGGIATGKSTFRKMLADRHPFTCFDADAFVHDLLATDATVIAAVQEAFGPETVCPGPAVNRRHLRRLVFSNPAARNRLEAIIHPRVRAAWQELLAVCARENRPFLADIPLLFETGGDRFFTATVVVACSPDVQRCRMAGRGLDVSTIEAMLASQLPLDEKVARSSVSVWNDGTMEALGRQADLLLSRLPSTLRPS
jgi:dephospho-CoA kinase